MDEILYKETKKHFSKLGMRYFLGTLIVFAFQVIALLIAGAAAPGLLDTTDTYLFVTSLPMYVISFPLMALLIRKVPAVHIEKRRMTVGQMLQAFCISYALIFLGNLAGLFITMGISVLKGAPVQNPIADIAMDLNPGTALLLMVLCAPVTEELIFRKLLVDRTAAYGEETAIVISGLLFGLFHGNLNQFTYAFVLGVFLGFIYVKTGNIVYSIILHMIINFIGSVANIALLGQLLSPEAVSDLKNFLVLGFIIFLYGIFILAVILTGIVLLIVKRRELRCAPGEIVIPRGRRFSATILNLGMILYILFWVIQIVLQLLQ